MDPKKRCDDINQLHPKVKELAEKLIKEAKAQGLNMKIIDTYRSKERQDYLYEQGRTRPGQIVTNAKGSDMSSYHNWRLAFDCIQNVPGKEYDDAFLKKLGKIGQSIGLEWGGGWSSFKDSPHFQYTFGLSIKDLKAGKTPPEYKPPTPPTPQKKTYTVTIEQVPVCVNGVVVMSESVNIEGSNFTKMRSLDGNGISVGFGEVPGHSGKMPIIDTKCK